MRTELSREATPVFPDRRRHVRYRFSAPITICAKAGAAIKGMSLEISESGMSALVSHELIVGETVELKPVASGTVSALVRRRGGKIYGFEFLNLTEAQVREIAEHCKLLPHYQSKALDI